MRKKTSESSDYVLQMLSFCSQSSAKEVLEFFNSSINGVYEKEINQRLKNSGLNVIEQSKKKNPVIDLFSRFITPLNLLLLILVAVSLFIGDARAAIIIAVMILISVFMSFFQETRSAKAAEKLQEMVSTTATVIRRQKKSKKSQKTEKKEVPLKYLVPGDVINLSAGDMVPADVRVILAKDLFVNQAALTGEALPVEKYDSEEGKDVKNFLELSNICFMGSNIVSGSATAVVILTGSNTYLGTLAGKIAEHKEATSFDKGINDFTWLLIRFMAIMAPAVFLINGLSKGDWLQAFVFAIAVTVGLTPEMLPMLVTVNLAKGALAMSKQKVIVKQLSSIQNLGAMDVLCADKTGTLTQNRIILEKHVDVYGNENEQVLVYAYLNSYYQTGLRSLLDDAVLKHLEIHQGLKIEKYRKVDEMPFDFQRRRMSVVLQENQKHNIIICKGAVEEIFQACGSAYANGKIFDLDKSHFEIFKNVARDLNEDGFRVIAVAYKEIPLEKMALTIKDESDLIMIGYVAFLDPPKETAAQALASLYENGVEVKILTGDNEVVTRKICGEVGLNVEQVMLGSEIEAMSASELKKAVEITTVFAKLSPLHKERVVRALRDNNHTVGFLGDGINDAAALKAADVGISVDTAVDIAKDSANIILLEKNLLVLKEGVIEGRKVFGNIMKYIRMGSSSNFGNMFSMLGASYIFPFLPMAPVQILIINLLYDLSQTMIPTDLVDADFLVKPRKWKIENIKRFMIFIGPVSSIFDYATFFVMIYVFNAWNNVPLFQTGWFTESILTELFIIHVIRTNKIPFFQSRASVLLIFATVIIGSFALYLPYSPLADSLGLVKMPHSYYIWLILIILSYLTLAQFVKTLFTRKFEPA